MEREMEEPISQRRYESRERFRTLRGIYAAAERNLSSLDWDYLWCGVGDELTVASNTEAFSQWLFRERLFAGIARPDTTVSFFGRQMAAPVLVAPFGNDAVFHPDGHLAVGRAAEAVGVLQMVPVAASYSLEDVARSSAAAIGYQMTMVGDEGAALEMIDRAKQAGYQFICASDSPTRQWRERLIESEYVPLRSHQDINFGPGKSDPSSLAELYAFTKPRWTWEQLARLIGRSSLPVIVKGVQNAADALRAVEAGASGLYVSNYGGRELDRTAPALAALPKVRAAVGAEVPIIFDSGIRRGSDIAVAIALGADVVAVGRLAALGLAAGGEDGVRRVLELLKEELWATMGRLGCTGVSQLTRDVVVCRHGNCGNTE